MSEREAIKALGDAVSSAGERAWRIVTPVNVPAEDSARLRAMSIFTSVLLIVVTLVAAYLLWSLLLRAEQLYTRLEGPTPAAADIAGIAFLGIAAVIVGGSAAALLLETRQLIRTLFF